MNYFKIKFCKECSSNRWKLDCLQKKKTSELFIHLRSLKTDHTDTQTHTQLFSAVENHIFSLICVLRISKCYYVQIIKSSYCWTSQFWQNSLGLMLSFCERTNELSWKTKQFKSLISQIKLTYLRLRFMTFLTHEKYSTHENRTHDEIRIQSDCHFCYQSISLEFPSW